MGWLKDIQAMTGLRVLPEDELVEKPVIGRNYHLSWAKKRGCVWKLEALGKKRAVLRTPKTNKKLVTNREYLRETNKSIIRKVKNRNQKLNPQL